MHLVLSPITPFSGGSRYKTSVTSMVVEPVDSGRDNRKITRAIQPISKGSDIRSDGSITKQSLLTTCLDGQDEQISVV